MEEKRYFTEKNKHREGTDVNLMDLMRVIRNKIWQIILIGFVFSVLGVCLCKYVLPDKYESTTTIYVLNRDNNSNVISSNELQTGSQLTKDYSVMITSRYVMEKVIDELQLDMTVKQLREHITVEVPSETRAINIIVTDKDPAQAQRIANAVRGYASEHIKNIMAVDAVNVVDEADYPTEKSSMRASVMGLIAAVIGVFLFISYVTFRFILDDTLKTREDIEKHLDLSTLALIPRDEAIEEKTAKGRTPKNGGKKQSKHPDTYEGDPADHAVSQSISTKSENLSFQTREAFKTLRSNIEFSGEGIKVINVTSCMPNEGKSEISFELSKAFAENGKKVLLVDADMRNSTMRTHFMKGRIAYGLSHFLVGNCSANAIVYKTDRANFHVIFSGPKTPSPAELLDSEPFSRLVEATKSVYDVVIIDSPPLGSVIDAAVIAKKCDGTVLVVSNAEVSFRLAQSVAEQLQRAGCRIFGCVLNKVNMKDASYYGHYYGKSYGKYGDRT